MIINLSAVELHKRGYRGRVRNRAEKEGESHAAAVQRGGVVAGPEQGRDSDSEMD
jgi:hypothetical protein